MRYLVIFVLVLILVVVGLYGYGSNLPEETTTKVSATYRQPIEKVWERISDYSAIPSWSEDMEKVERVEDLEGFPVWRFTPKKGDPMDIQVVRSEKPGLHIGKIVNNESLPFGGTWIFQLKSLSENETQVTLTEDGYVKSIIGRAICHLIGKDRMLKSHLADIGKSFSKTVEVR